MICDMAKVLDQEPIWNTRKGRYDWDSWFNGQVWHLTKGTEDEVADGLADFSVPSGSLRAAAQNAARTRGLKLKAKVTAEGDLQLRASRPEPAEPQAVSE